MTYRNEEVTSDPINIQFLQEQDQQWGKCDSHLECVAEGFEKILDLSGDVGSRLLPAGRHVQSLRPSKYQKSAKKW